MRFSIFVQLSQILRQLNEYDKQYIYKEGKLEQEATVKEYLTVQKEGNRHVKRKKEYLLLIDNYVDESVLLMLSKRNAGVTADIYTQSVSHQLQLDVQKHNSQYPPIDIHTYKKSHDRFLIIDGTDIYHIGASLKDLGKKMFAFSKLDIPATAITALL